MSDLYSKGWVAGHATARRFYLERLTVRREEVIQLRQLNANLVALNLQLQQAARSSDNRREVFINYPVKPLGKRRKLIPGTDYAVGDTVTNSLSGVEFTVLAYYKDGNSWTDRPIIIIRSTSGGSPFYDIGLTLFKRAR